VQKKPPGAICLVKKFERIMFFISTTTSLCCSTTAEHHLHNFLLVHR
jgi:hypothetical protein